MLSIYRVKGLYPFLLLERHYLPYSRFLALRASRLSVSWDKGGGIKRQLRCFYMFNVLYYSFFFLY